MSNHDHFDIYQRDRDSEGYSEACRSHRARAVQEHCEGLPFSQNEEERSMFSMELEGVTMSSSDQNSYTMSQQENSPNYQYYLSENRPSDYIQPFSQPLVDSTCRVEPDGNKPRKQPSWLNQPAEHGAKQLTTAKHNEFDVLTYSKPTNGKGISDTKDFHKETYRNACRLIPKTITNEQWESGIRGTISTLGNVRLDNQGDITMPGGEKFTNFQLQSGRDTMACVLLQKEQNFGFKHIRRAFHESLEKQEIVHLHRHHTGTT